MDKNIEPLALIPQWSVSLWSVLWVAPRTRNSRFSVFFNFSFLGEKWGTRNEKFSEKLWCINKEFRKRGFDVLQ